MKNAGNFLIGMISSLGVSAALPETAKSVAEVSPGVIDSVEALISLVSGLLSAIVVAWIKKKWDKK